MTHIRINQRKTCRRPASMSDRAWALRRIFYPYLLARLGRRTVEIISFPVPNDNSISLMVREPNNPATLQEVVLEYYTKEAGNESL